MDYLKDNMQSNSRVSGAEGQSLPTGTMTPRTQAGKLDAQSVDTYMMKIDKEAVMQMLHIGAVILGLVILGVVVNL